MLKPETSKLAQDFLKTAKKPLLVIVGATCSGKTSLSIELAKKINGEIISADSRQIFRKLNIGTAKISPEEMQGVPHYLIDILEPDEKFTVAEFKEMAIEKIEDILKRKKIPLLVGGTGLYINAVTQNFSIPQVPPNPVFRKKLSTFSNEELHAKLQKLDPAEAEKIHPNNRIYLERALEIIETTGQPKSKIIAKKKSDYDILILGIQLNREELYERINQRVEQMMQTGFIEEVQDLMKQGYDFNSQAFNSVGYREIKDMLAGKISKNDALELIKKNTRNYAKRQLTWWRNDERVKWIDKL